MANAYILPKLKYGFSDLKPFLSEEQLKIHYEKHHQAYVTQANAIFEKLDKAKTSGEEIDMKATLKALAFNVGGHVLHSLFWENMSPKPAKLSPALEKALNAEYGSIDRFKKLFTQTAMTVEGSGWAALVYDKVSGRPLLMQVEKHNVNLYPNHTILLVCDAFEHAYYIDYKNEKAKFFDGFWNVADMGVASKRFESAAK